MADKQIIPIFPLPEVVLFPGMNLPILIFEQRYRDMITECLKKDKTFGAVLSKEDLCAEVGTIAQIIDSEEMSDERTNILVEGKNRFKIINLITTKTYNEAEIEIYKDSESKLTASFKKTIKTIREMSLEALELYNSIYKDEAKEKLKLPEDPSELLFLVAANLTCSYVEKQTILETISIKERADKVLDLLEEELKKLEVMLENKETQKEVIKNGKLKI